MGAGIESTGGIDLANSISGAEELQSKLAPLIDTVKDLTTAVNELSGKTAKVKIDIDTTKANPDKIDDINSALDTLENKINAPKQKMKYFQTLENAAADLKKVWNQLATEVNNGNISPDKIIDSSAATKVLRYANAYEALGGNIAEISSEIEELVSGMRQLDKYSSAKGYNFTVTGFESAFAEFKKLQSLGVIEFEGFKEAKTDALELLSIVQKTKKEFSDSSKTDTNDSTKNTSEETKKTILTLEELKQKLNDINRIKQSYNGENEWEIDDIDWDSEISDIERYSKALEQLKERQKASYDSAIYWRKSAEDHYNVGENEKGDTKIGWMEKNIQEYHQYTDQVNYVQEQLHKATMEYQPAEGPAGESVKVLILLLQNLNSEISQIRQAFDSIDDNNGFKNLLSSMQNITDQISQMLIKVESLTEAFSRINFNINLDMGNNSNPIQQNVKYGIEARKTVDSLIESYNDLISVLKQAGYTEDQVLAKAGKNNFNLFNVFEDTGSKSNPAKMNAYLTIIKEYSKVAKELGIDLSSWGTKWNTSSLDKVVDDTNKIITGEQNVEEQTKRLFDLFGGNNTNLINGNFEVMSDQLTEIKSQLIELTTLLSRGLSLKNLTDENGEIKSEASALDNVKSSVDLVSEAIREKNSLFVNEASIVKESVLSEINSLQLLIDKIQSVQKEIIQLNNTVIAPTINSSNIGNNNSNKAISGTNFDNAVIDLKGSASEFERTITTGKEYVETLGEVYDATRKIRTVEKDGKKEQRISYELKGETGNKITVGENGNLIGASTKTHNALSQKKQEAKNLEKEVTKGTKAYEKMHSIMLEINRLNPDTDKSYISQLKKEGQDCLDIYNEVKTVLKQVSDSGDSSFLQSLESESNNITTNYKKQLLKDNSQMADNLRKSNKKKYEEEQKAQQKQLEKAAKEQEKAEQKRLKNLYKQTQNKSNLNKEEENQLRQQKANDIVEKQLLAYKEIYDAKVKLSKLDEEDSDNAKEITRQKERIANFQKMYVEQSKLSHAYDDIINKEKRSADLAKIASKAQKQMGTSLVNKKEVVRINSVEKAYNHLAKTKKRIIELEAKKNKDTITSKQQEELDKLISEEKRARDLIEARKKSEKELTVNEKQAKSRYEESESNISVWKNQAEEYEEKISNTIKNTKSLMDSIHNAKNDIDGFENAYQSTQENIDVINNKLKEGKYKTLADYTKDIQKEANKLKDVFKVIDPVDINASEKARIELEKYINEISNGTAKIGPWDEAHQKLTAEYVNERNELVKLEGAYEKTTGALSIGTKKIGKNVTELEKGFSRWQAKLKDLFRYISTYVGFQEIWQAFKQGIQITKEFDTAVTELYKVAKENKEVLNEFAQSAFNVAEVVGSTGTEIVNAAADWERLGYSIDKASKLAEAAAIYTNVGDGIDIDAANTSLVSTIQGFQIEANKAMSVIDKFNEVANNFPINSAGIGEALQRSAASFNAANTDLSESIALITATNAVVQDPDKVGKHNAHLYSNIQEIKVAITVKGQRWFRPCKDFINIYFYTPIRKGVYFFIKKEVIKCPRKDNYQVII